MAGFLNRRTRIFCLASIALVLGLSAHAEERKLGWQGTAGLGYLSASGNADNFNLNASLDLGYNTELWDHVFRALAIGASAGGEQSAERYTADLKSSRNLSDVSYVFGLLAYQKDRFSGVREQTSASLGYGRRLINTDIHTLSVEAGIGYRELTFNDFTKDSGVILRAGSDYRWNFSDNAHFDQRLAIESGSDNTSIESISSVSANLIETLKLVAAFTIKHNTDVPAANTNTDRFTSISLEYAW